MRQEGNEDDVDMWQCCFFGAAEGSTELGQAAQRLVS